MVRLKTHDIDNPVIQMLYYCTANISAAVTYPFDVSVNVSIHINISGRNLS